LLLCQQKKVGRLPGETRRGLAQETNVIFPRKSPPGFGRRPSHFLLLAQKKVTQEEGLQRATRLFTSRTELVPP